jgi:hypothetical protein
MTRSRDTASIIPTVDAKGDLLVGTADNTVDNLPAGTNGTYLKANSASTTGLEWATGVESIVDAKGDLLVGTADNTIDNLPTGTNGQFLTANSATTTGLEWTTPASTGNAIINGGFDIWQRGTSFASGAAIGYRADRWIGLSGSSQAVERSTDVPSSNFAYSAITTTSSNAFNTLSYRIEEQQAIQLIGTATFSLYAKNLSGTTGLRLQLRTPTAKDNWSSSTSILILVLAEAGSFNSEWQRYSVTFEIPSGVKDYGLGLEIQRTASGTTSFAITGVQLEAGPVATPFRRNANSLQAELAACQRYYFRGGNAATGIFNGATTARFSLPYPVEMRSQPTISAIAAPIIINPQVVETQTGSSVTNFVVDANGGTRTTRAASKIQFGGFASGADGRVCAILNDCLEFSAEL